MTTTSERWEAARAKFSPKDSLEQTTQKFTITLEVSFDIEAHSHVEALDFAHSAVSLLSRSADNGWEDVAIAVADISPADTF